MVNVLMLSVTTLSIIVVSVFMPECQYAEWLLLLWSNKQQFATRIKDTRRNGQPPKKSTYQTSTCQNVNP
jgi:hypothetical protein